MQGAVAPGLQRGFAVLGQVVAVFGVFRSAASSEPGPLAKIYGSSTHLRHHREALAQHPENYFVAGDGNHRHNGHILPDHRGHRCSGLNRFY